MFLPAIFLLLLLAAGAHAALPPLTTIQATSIEQSAFVRTLMGALEKHQKTGSKPALVNSPPPPSTLSTSAQNHSSSVTVVHVVGASEVEVAVDWSPICALGVRLLLVGPKIDPGALRRHQQKPPCVSAITALYSRAAVSSALSASDHEGDTSLQSPDLVVGFNLDIYMPYWRRTVADLLQSRTPVVITFYCAYEGYKFDRVLKWPEIEFSDKGFGAAPAVQAERKVGEGHVPDAVFLWKFQPNPHAHAKPINCYADAVMKGEQHGVRNSFWVSFSGQDAPVDAAQAATTEL